ncbi:right-handed parallel beta-helix repeat-containing protein [Kribbella deserti]|uniref:Right-handed parallel beta-helix repeat-containing protein n=1 Tax=Kribbella deserti TaxID=1926257 RepID=A0ABV6QIK6_9ACTN
MKKLLYAAIIAVLVSAGTVWFARGGPADSSAATSKATPEAVSRYWPGHTPTTKWPTKRPRPTATPTASATVKPSTTPTTTASSKPTPTVPPTTSTKPPTPPVPPPTTTPPANLTVGPAVAGPCSGTPIKLGQDPQSVINSKPAGTTFCFAAGVHRITKTLRPKANQVLASSVGAVLSGSVRLSDSYFKPSGNKWVVRGALPAAYGKIGQCEDEQANICDLREQIFFDGKHLTRVASLSQVTPTSFYGDYSANAIYIGRNPAGHSIEMSKTAQAIGTGGTGVTVRGLTIEHFASPAQSAAVEIGPGWQAIANEFRDNHAVGLKLARADKAVVRANRVTRNGQLGISQWRSQGAQILRNEIDNNNTDGFWIADWESGGIKSTWSSGLIEANHVHNNLGIGIWSDIEETNKVIKGNRIDQNAACGIRYEISYNGTIIGNTITNNGFGVRRTGAGGGKSLFDGGGINVNTSSNVRIEGNTLAGNRNGVAVQSRNRGTATGGQGTFVLRNVKVINNEIDIASGTATIGAVYLGSASIPAGAVTFSGNQYNVDTPSASRFNWMNKLMTASQWKSIGNDTTGTFR